MFPDPDTLLEVPGGTRRGGVSSGNAIPVEAVCDARKSDPFFRGLDATLRTEREIRERALGMLDILETDPWKVGGPEAQRTEMVSAYRILIESMARSACEIARAEKWEIV